MSPEERALMDRKDNIIALQAEQIEELQKLADLQERTIDAMGAAAKRVGDDIAIAMEHSA